jgi:membrane associated rhomboid family serine protease
METTFTCVPYVNVGFIIITSLIFFMPEVFLSSSDLNDFVLRDWSASSLIGNMFLHGNFFHLLGNMLFLWIFGNAVCAAVGNVSYFFLYIFLGIIAAVFHLSADAHPAIGASGAINGVVGMALVLFPKNKLHCWYWLLWISGRFTVCTYWMILYWFVFDIIGSAGSPDGIAHWAHIGGLIGGILIAVCAIKFKLIESYHYTIFDIIAGRNEKEDRIRSSVIEQQVNTAIVSGFIAPQLEESIDQNASVSVAPPPPVPTFPDIQLKKCVGGGTSLTLYIVNNGATMNSLSLKLPQGVKAQLSPTIAFRRGETGSIRFSTDNIPIDSIEFIIVYNDSLKAPHKIRFRCVPSTSALEVVTT